MQKWQMRRIIHLIAAAYKSLVSLIHNGHPVICCLSQVGAADMAGAQQMVASSIALSKGVGDLNSLVEALSLLQHLLKRSNQTDKAAQNHNYLGKKQEELSERIQAAEAIEQQYREVLLWDLRQQPSV